MSTFAVTIDAWANGATIPDRFAFGTPGTDGPFATSDNVSPAIAWSGAPQGTRSFAIVVVDPDVPSKPDDVNQADREVPSDLPRADFFHWTLINIPPSVTRIDEGAASNGVVAKGKPVGPQPIGVTGKNDYTSWFDGDPDMGGTYGSYDGPCPPWNDSIVHHYHFKVFALDVESLPLEGAFSGGDVMAAIEGHVLASAEWVGTYTMNKRLR